MFKKALSLILTLSLILSLIACVFANEVAADGEIINLDFENYPSGGALNRFKIADSGDADHGKALYGNFTADDCNASPAAAIMTSSQTAKLTAGTTYEISLSYKAINLNSTFALHLLYSDNANSYVRKKIPGTTTNTPAASSPYLVRFAHNGAGVTTRNQWIDVTLNFTAEYDAYVYLGFWSNAVNEFYIDNVKIGLPTPTDPTLVVKHDFENYPSGGALNRFKVADSGDADHGKALYGNFTADDCNASPAASIMNSPSTKLTAGTTYEISLSYKAINLNSTFALHLLYSDNANSYVRKKIPGTTTNTPAASSPYLVRFAHNGAGVTPLNQWIDVSLSFTAEYDAYVYLGFWSNAANEFYIDNVVISKVEAVSINFNTLGGNNLTPVKGKAGTVLPALPTPVKENMDFVGWYTDEGLTNFFADSVFPAEDITLYAKYQPEGIYNQDFENYVVSGTVATNTLSVHTAKEANDQNVHGGIRSLYRPKEVSSYFASLFPNTTKKIEKDKGYRISMWVKVATEITKTTEGAIQLTFLSDRKNATARIADVSNKNIQYFSYTYAAGEWKYIELNFVSPADAYVGLYSYGGTELYIDDVSLIEVPLTTVTFKVGNGNAIAPIKGVPGSAITVTNPTHPEGMTFAGWYRDPQFNTKYTLRTQPNEDMTLYAKWIPAGSFEQTFEDYYYEVGGSHTSYNRSGYTVYHAKDENDPFVRNGSTSMRYKNDPLKETSFAYSFSIFDPTMGQLTIGEKYRVSVHMKFNAIAATFYHALYNNSVVDNPGANYAMKMYSTVHGDILNPTKPLEEYCHGIGDKLKVSGPDENGWYCFTYEATATDKYFSMYLAYDAEVYIDDITITPLATGVVDENYSTPYAEPLYDEIYSNYPTALTEKGDEVKIYQLDLVPRGDYVFSVGINKPGVWAALSFDADGKNIIEGTKITSGEAVKRIVLNMSGTLYLIVNNPVGDNGFSRLMLFNTRAGKEKLNTNKSPEISGEIPELSDLLKDEKYADVLLDATFPIEGVGNDSTDASPTTGEANLPAVALIIALTAILLMTATLVKTKKHQGGKNND